MSTAAFKHTAKVGGQISSNTKGGLFPVLLIPSPRFSTKKADSSCGGGPFAPSFI